MSHWIGKPFLLAGQPMQSATGPEHATSLQTATLQPWLWLLQDNAFPYSMYIWIVTLQFVINYHFPYYKTVQSASCMASFPLWFMFSCNCLIYETRICCWVSDTAQCVKIPATEPTLPRTYMVQTEKEKWHLQLCSDYLTWTMEYGLPDYPLYTQINECSNKKNWLLSLPRHLRKDQCLHSPSCLSTPLLFFSCTLHTPAFSGWHTTHTHPSLTV